MLGLYCEMRKFWLKYCLYGCILCLMGRKIWTRTHEESKINLRPAFQPDSSGRTLSPADSYQNIQPVDYGYARRPIYRNTELNQADADYIVCSGKTYRNAPELFQGMEMQVLEGGSGSNINNITITTVRR